MLKHYRPSPGVPIQHPVPHIHGEVVHKAPLDLLHGRGGVHGEGKSPWAVIGDDSGQVGAVVQHLCRAGDLEEPVEILEPVGRGLRSKAHEHTHGRYCYGPAMWQGVLLSPGTEGLTRSFRFGDDGEGD